LNDANGGSKRFLLGVLQIRNLAATESSAIYSNWEVNFMAILAQDIPKVKLSGKEKWLIVGLLCLQVPSTIIFIPLAAVLVLTGILAPLGMMSFAIGMRPFSMAMKIKTQRRSED
jgi:hypothetical protein